MERRAWWATVHGVAKSQTQLLKSHTHTHTHTHTHDYMYILGKKFINWLLPNLFREVYSVIDRLSPGL